MRTSSWGFIGVAIIALVAALSIGTANAQAQSRSCVVTVGGNCGSNGPKFEFTVPRNQEQLAQIIATLFTYSTYDTSYTLQDFQQDKANLIQLFPNLPNTGGNGAWYPGGNQIYQKPEIVIPGWTTGVCCAGDMPYLADPSGNRIPPPQLADPSGNPFHLGMYVSPGSTDAIGAIGGVGASLTRGSGIGITDSAGLFAPGTTGPNVKDTTSGGGIAGSYDAGRFLPTNQGLLFNGAFNYASDNLVAAGFGSAQANTYTFGGSFLYNIGATYMRGRAALDFGHGSETLNDYSNNGSFNTRGYSTDLRIGHVFALNYGQSRSTGAYGVGLDVSGHLGYNNQQLLGFTDNSGFIYGTGQTQYGDIGGRAKLFAVIPNNASIWMPYVAGTVDREFDFSSILNIPTQPTLTGGDLVSLQEAQTFWGAELGTDVQLNIFSHDSPTVGIKAFYQASANIQTVGGSAFLKIPLSDPSAVAVKDSGIRILPSAANGAYMPVKAPYDKAPPAIWSWAGLYIGAHVGGALSTTKFSDPFGAPIYGDTVRSPGFLGGGQIGYNWQALGSRWVFGVEADASLMGSDGDATCFAASSVIVTTTCRVQPRATGTFTGRVGYAFGQDRRTLVYGKAGLALANDEIDMALNGLSVGPVRANAPEFSNNQSVTLWGGTVGVGVERALTPAWSLKAEYDYVDLGRGNVANVGGETIMPLPPYTVGVIPPGTSGVSQNIQEVKLGLNYKWGADPWAPGWKTDPSRYPIISSAAGWEVEGGGRYFGSWGEFHKDFGIPQTLGPNLSDVSRLNYDDMQTNSGEFFGRIDTPWNLFVKGYIGGGATNTGHMNDEDIVLINGLFVGAYSNTLSPAITGNIGYGVIDGGYDFLRGPGYKVGAFAGYFHFNQGMSAFGCTPIAFNNCTPNPVPTSGSPVITENDKWDAVRIGVAAETMLTDRVEISGEAAYLPRLWVNGLDQHFVGNTGVLAKIFPASGNGSGVQLEALLSYYLTSRWSVGAGARYWGMWTTPNGQWNCTFGCGGAFAAPQFYKAQVEQLGAFVQTSYKFDWGASVVALH